MKGVLSSLINISFSVFILQRRLHWSKELRHPYLWQFRSIASHFRNVQYFLLFIIQLFYLLHLYVYYKCIFTVRFLVVKMWNSSKKNRKCFNSDIIMQRNYPVAWQYSYIVTVWKASRKLSSHQVTLFSAKEITVLESGYVALISSIIYFLL